MRPNSNPHRLPIRNIRRGVKFQNKIQSHAPTVRTRPCFPSAEKIPVQLCLTALMVLDPANMPAESLIFHGEDKIEFLATIN